MKKEIILEKYPVFILNVKKDETEYKNSDEIIDYFKGLVDKHPIAKFIAIFDHYTHTTSLESGEINQNIKDAKNIVFCFGQKLPDPKMLSVRPRSIGVCELEDEFIISFLETPLAPMNDIMEGWVKSVVK